MSNESDNNKRIAKNTLLLYFRLIFTVLVGLFTSRVILNTLGVEDYGVYNVVGGVVAMFSLFTASLSAAISRFLTYSIGKNDTDRLKVVFSTSLSIQLGMALLISLLCEILGIWFLNSYVNIPPERMEAANWVMQFSILTFAINLINIPYNATIIAHEKMSAFAYISILETFLKLFVAYSLYISPFDKLKTYGCLLSVVAFIICCVYYAYCKRKFVECSFSIIVDKSLLKEMSQFAGWNLLGSGAYLFNTQGVNIVTNVFFGVSANAARGVSNQVEGIIKQFVTNFTTAINPQITKSYAAGNLPYMYSLVCRGAKFSYLLMLFGAVPLMFETETIMKIWLKTYPIDAPLFLRLSIIGTMLDMLGNSTANAAWATGNIKHYYKVIASVGSLVFPFSWFAFILGAPAYTSYIVFIIIYLIVCGLKLKIIKGLIKFPIKMFYTDVVKKIIPCTIIAFLCPAAFYFSMETTLIRTMVVIIVSEIAVCLSIYLMGFSKGERIFINSKIYAISTRPKGNILK